MVWCSAEGQNPRMPTRLDSWRAQLQLSAFQSGRKVPRLSFAGVPWNKISTNNPSQDLQLPTQPPQPTGCSDLLGSAFPPTRGISSPDPVCRVPAAVPRSHMPRTALPCLNLPVSRVYLETTFSCYSWVVPQTSPGKCQYRSDLWLKFRSKPLLLKCGQSAHETARGKMRRQRRGGDKLWIV
jgi:hypothetical protein